MSNVLSNNIPLESKVFSVTNLANLSGIEGTIVFCEDNGTFYRFYTHGTTFILNGTSVLNTSDGGNTRWVGIAGQYGLKQKKRKLIY